VPRAWDGLVHFMTNMLEKQGRDKGLRDAMFSRQTRANLCGEPHEDVVRAKVQPFLADLVASAQQEGDLREDVTLTDVGVLLICAIGMVDFTAPVDPDVWRRHLAVILDGLRARPAGTGTALTQRPLDDEEMDVCMIGWKYGTRQTSRHRPKPA
jgi:hypothetical protein